MKYCFVLATDSIDIKGRLSQSFQEKHIIWIKKYINK